jgi:alpha-1,6-mannosyltransferase
MALAWRQRGTRRGFAGTLLIAIGSLSPAFLPRSSPWWTLFDNAKSLATSPVVRTVGTVVAMIGVLLLVDAWLRLRPRDRDGAAISDGVAAEQAQVAHWAVLLIWSIPFLGAPPIFSQDAYSYAAQGWLVHNGISPYDVGPGYLPGAYADQVDTIWRQTTAPYGPLSLQISNLLVDVTRFHPYLTAWAERVPALIGVLMIGLLLPRVARRASADIRFTTWFAMLNPMLVISFVGGEHNDALMMGFVVLAVWFAYWPGPVRWPRLRGWWWLVGALVLGVGMAIKQPALLTAYALPLIARGWADWSRREVLITLGRVLVSFGVAIGSFALTSLATGLGFGWIHSITVPGRNMTVAPSTMIGIALKWVMNRINPAAAPHAGVETAVQSVAVGIGAVIVIVLAVTVARRKPMTFLSFGYLTAAIAMPSLRTWYVQWCVTLAPLADMRARMVRVAVWGTLVMLGFDACQMAMRNRAISIGLAAMVLCAWIAWTHDRAHRRGLRARLLAVEPEPSSA